MLSLLLLHLLYNVWTQLVSIAASSYTKTNSSTKWPLLLILSVLSDRHNIQDIHALWFIHYTHIYNYLKKKSIESIPFAVSFMKLYLVIYIHVYYYWNWIILILSSTANGTRKLKDLLKNVTERHIILFNSTMYKIRMVELTQSSDIIIVAI